MASAFANASTHWNIRINGSQLNSGGFDPYVAGATTDYTYQDTAQISSATGTCTVGSTTWTDTSQAFTTALKGNTLRISAHTGGTATALDTFVILDAPTGTTLTLDRSPCASTNITAATYTIGGAFAGLQSLALTATGSLTAPTLPAPLLAGNTIYIQGSGSNDPSTNDYDLSAGTYTFASGTTGTDGGAKVPITLIGYNGKPRIAHCGGLITAQWDMKNVSAFRKLGTNLVPIINFASFALSCAMTNCILDQNGFDVCEWYGSGSGFIANTVRNTGGGGAGTAQVLCAIHPSGPIALNYVNGVRGPAVCNYLTGQQNTTFADICYNTIVNCKSDAIQLTVVTDLHSYNNAVHHNTIDNNAGAGVTCATTVFASLSMFNNIFSNCGTYALNLTDSAKINARLQMNPIDANCYYNNAADFNTVSSAPSWTYQANDIQANPGYANSSAGNYVTGANVRGKGLSGLGGVDGTMGGVQHLVNIGAYQGAVLGGLFLPANLSGIGAGGPFFQNPLG